MSVVVTQTDASYQVSVSDSGLGISEEDSAAIFDEFRQADSLSTREQGGTGLGLSIAKRLIELHGGSIWVDSELGVGSTFAFRLPQRVESQGGAAGRKAPPGVSQALVAEPGGRPTGA